MENEDVSHRKQIKREQDTNNHQTKKQIGIKKNSSRTQIVNDWSNRNQIENEQKTNNHRINN